MPAPDKPPELMFAEELLGVFIRWSDESDLEPLEMAQTAAVVINNFCNEDAIEFEPDFEVDDEE